MKMKIRSITDVITNSSSEVFTLRTDKTLTEVHQWLKDNIKWRWSEPPTYDPFTEPEIMEKGTGIIDWLVDFGDLWDSKDQDSVEDYKAMVCLKTGSTHIFGGDDREYDFVIKKGGMFLQRAFEKYCDAHMTELLGCFEDYKNINTAEDFWDRYDRENYGYEPYIWPGEYWSGNPCKEFLREFCRWYESEYPDRIPGWWKIPEHLDVQYWKGKIGFSTTDENSISWEDMEKICNEFDGEHWHMG